MDDTEIKHVVEAALLAAGRPLTVDRLLEIFTKKGSGPDRAGIKRALEALASDYASRGIEIKEVASGYRVQVKRTMSDWLAPLWEERAPRYTRALLETLALVAYRQPITRAEIEEVRGVVVSTNIVRTLLERSWIRVVGHRDVPGKPAMFGTTREFLDYFGLKRLEDLPPLAELKDGFPELSPQADLIESLDTGPHLTVVGDEDTEGSVEHEPAQHALVAGNSGPQWSADASTPDAFAPDASTADASTVDPSAPDSSAVMAEDSGGASAEVPAEEDALLEHASPPEALTEQTVTNDSLANDSLANDSPTNDSPTNDSSAHDSAANDGPDDRPADDDSADERPGNDSDRKSTDMLDEDSEHDGEREALRAKASD